MSQSSPIDRLAEMTLYLQRHFLISLNHRASSFKLSVSQFTLLGLLAENGALTMGHVAALMGHSTPAATGLVDRMAKAGWVCRKPSPEDRRQVYVEITNQGRKVVEAARQDMLRCLEEVNSRLSTEDRKAWLRIYETLTAYSEESRRACH